MIHYVDELLEQILKRELPSGTQVVFDQPTRDWKRPSDPSLNFFLYDIRENVKWRNISPAWSQRDSDRPGRTKMEPPWKRLDLYYMLTAWGNTPSDEHLLLSLCLNILFRHPKIYIPNTEGAASYKRQYPDLPSIDFPEGLLDQPSPLMVQVAQPDAMTKPSDIWSVLDNDMRAAISCVVTVAIKPYAEVDEVLVRTLDVRLGQTKKPTEEEFSPRTLQNSWSVGGLFETDKPLKGIVLTILEHNLRLAINSNGTWRASTLLHQGIYTLKATNAEGNKFSTCKIEVPSYSYDFKWSDKLKQVYFVEGKIHVKAKESLEDIHLTLVEHGLKIPIESDGRWKIKNSLDRGKYTIALKRGEENELSRCEIEVPSNEYHLQWFDELKQVWSVGGWLETNKPIESTALILVAHNLDIPIKSDGTWKIGEFLDRGRYIIEASISVVNKSSRCEIEVPSNQYHLQWFDKLEQITTNPE